MYLFPLILGVVLLPEAYALKCQECSSENNCRTKDCSPGLQCIDMRVTVFTGNSKVSDIRMKGCGSSEQCVQGSVNYGLARTVLTTKCCSTDFCNSQSVPETSLSKPNGKKCFSCDGQQCTGTLNCLGNEDHCISSTVSSGGMEVKLKGCASTKICSAINIPQLQEVMGQEHDCCQGDFCNSASSTSAGLLLSVVPLISLVLFS